MSFSEIAKEAKKAFQRRYSEHNRLTKEIEKLYRVVFPRATEEQRKRVTDLHDECQAKIHETKLKFEKEMTEKFTLEVDKFELEYMKKEKIMLNLLRDSLDGKDALIQAKIKKHG